MTLVLSATVLSEAARFTGQPYRFGAEGDTKPDSWVGPVDCSELVQIACKRAGVYPAMPDGAFYQWVHTARQRITVDEARRTHGALFFVGDGTGTGRDAITHVAFSLGDGRTFEARGKAWPVGIFAARSGWSYASLIPGVDHRNPTTTPPPPPESTMPPTPAVVDLAGIIAFVDLAYAKHGRGPADELAARLDWVQKAGKGPDPWAVLDEMLVMFATEG